MTLRIPEDKLSDLCTRSKTANWLRVCSDSTVRSWTLENIQSTGSSVHVPVAMSRSQWAQLSGCSQSKNSITLDRNYLLTVKKSKIIKTAVAFFEILLKCAVLASLVPIVPRFNHIQWQYRLITAKSVLCPSFRKIYILVGFSAESRSVLDW